MRTPLRVTSSAAALIALTLTGCAGSAPPSTGPEHAAPAPHVHAIVASPDGDGFLLGTHDGIYAATEDGKLGTRVGRHNFDAMGLTGHDGTLVASGHPGTNTPAELGEGNLGIIRSQDGGVTWAPVAFTGEKDFHALASSPDGALYGQPTDDAELLTSTDDGVTWTPTGANVLAFGLTVDAAGRIIATTTDGPQVSIDQGASFAPLPDAPNLYVITASPDRTRLVGVDNNDVVWSSTASDTQWRKAGNVHGSVQAIAITDPGEVLVVDDSGLSMLAPPM